MKEKNISKALFAGGCFWCMEPPFRVLYGVEGVTCGYTGGHVNNPTYEQVCSGTTGHLEAIEVCFDPQKVSYAYLLEEFWQQIDPTDNGGAFVDRGTQYQTAIFYLDENQKQLAEESKTKLGLSQKFNKPIATKILKATTFYPAEDYHQRYDQTHTARYKTYRDSSGRDEFIQEHWHCPLKKVSGKLTPLQFHVTQENGTEPPFHNAYWDNHRAGLYVDVVSGEPLFTSLDKFDSGCGWPSFTQPVFPDRIVEKKDVTHGVQRTEVRSQKANAHLGHVFDDGPGPKGVRYCINSAALRFIPVEDLVKEGYGEFVERFGLGKK